MNLTNYFLISSPNLNDHIFGHSLVYICEHDNNGAMGLIINKPFPQENLNIILKETGLIDLKPLPNIYLGGPVGMNNGLFLHTSKYSTKGTQKISNEISITSNNSVIHDLSNGIGPENFRFSLGYTGWDKKQLDTEVENGDWLLMPASSQLIFNIPDEKKWHKASSEFGVDITNIHGNAGFA